LRVKRNLSNVKDVVSALIKKSNKFWTFGGIRLSDIQEWIIDKYTWLISEEYRHHRRIFNIVKYMRSLSDDDMEFISMFIPYDYLKYGIDYNSLAHITQGYIIKNNAGDKL
jgi:hypothetical protein